MITTKTELDQKCSKYSQETSLVDVVDHCLLSGQVSNVRVDIPAAIIYRF